MVCIGAPATAFAPVLLTEAKLEKTFEAANFLRPYFYFFCPVSAMPSGSMRMTRSL